MKRGGKAYQGRVNWGLSACRLWYETVLECLYRRLTIPITWVLLWIKTEIQQVSKMCPTYFPWIRWTEQREKLQWSQIMLCAIYWQQFETDLPLLCLGYVATRIALVKHCLMEGQTSSKRPEQNCHCSWHWKSGIELTLFKPELGKLKQ